MQDEIRRRKMFSLLLKSYEKCFDALSYFKFWSELTCGSFTWGRVGWYRVRRFPQKPTHHATQMIIYTQTYIRKCVHVYKLILLSLSVTILIHYRLLLHYHLFYSGTLSFVTAPSHVNTIVLLFSNIFLSLIIATRWKGNPRTHRWPWPDFTISVGSQCWLRSVDCSVSARVWKDYISLGELQQSLKFKSLPKSSHDFSSLWRTF